MQLLQELFQVCNVDISRLPQDLPEGLLGSLGQLLGLSGQEEVSEVFTTDVECHLDLVSSGIVFQV